MGNTDNEKLFSRLIFLSGENNIEIVIKPLKSKAKGMLVDNTIGLSNKLSVEEMNYTLAHELAHYFLHYDKGDTITSEKHAEYEEQADRAAKMLLTALSVQ